MVAMVFMVLYIVAGLCMAVVLGIAWKDGVDDCPPIVGMLLAVVCSIGWPILVIGVMCYIVKYGLTEEEEP